MSILSSASKVAGDHQGGQQDFGDEVSILNSYVGNQNLGGGGGGQGGAYAGYN